MKKLFLALLMVLSFSSCSTVGVINENSYLGFDEEIECIYQSPHLDPHELMMY